MATRLKIYNDALIICGEATLSGLTDIVEPRYLLDNVWDNDGVKYCLEAGQWRFAVRSQRIDYTTTISPDFGYNRAFTKPSDWCVTVALCSDEYFNVPLLHYVDESAYWYADLDEIYVRFVSNDSSFGGDLSLWSAHFARFVAAHFASRIIMKLTSDENKRAQVIALEEKFRKEAKSRDAMADPTRFPAQGSWNASRRGGTRRDRGNRNDLIG